MTQEFTPVQQSQPPIYAVNHVEDTFGPATFGGSNRIMRVWLDIEGKPNVTYVDVPFSEFTAESVRERAQQHAAEWLAVSAIQHEGL